MNERIKKILEISIHALREEGDGFCCASDSLSSRISIHALREEGDLKLLCPFSSTADFNPRPPRGGRPSLFVKLKTFTIISIHALREEGDASR